MRACFVLCLAACSAHPTTATIDGAPGGAADAPWSAGTDAPASAADAGPAPGVAIYWGQNGYGGAHPGDPSQYERPLADVCADPAYDVVILAFMTSFVSAPPTRSRNGRRSGRSSTWACPRRRRRRTPRAG